MWEFDDVYTAPDGGFHDAKDYYAKSAAENTLSSIAIPALIITAQDDPFIPFDIFDNPSLIENAFIQLLAPTQGGHCGFFQHRQPQEDPFWAENRIVDWIQHQIHTTTTAHHQRDTASHPHLPHNTQFS
jgi:hypothetical protein